MNGVSASSAARRAITARSAASCGLRANRIPQPQSVTERISSCPAWMVMAWEASDRAATWKTIARRLPAEACSTSDMHSNSCPAVNVVTRPPASANPSQADAALWPHSDSSSWSDSLHRLRPPGPAPGPNARTCGRRAGSDRRRQLARDAIPPRSRRRIHQPSSGCRGISERARKHVPAVLWSRSWRSSSNSLGAVQGPMVFNGLNGFSLASMRVLAH